MSATQMRVAVKAHESAVLRVEALSTKKINWTCSDQAQKGDQICYISNLHKLQSHYPAWGVTRDVTGILEDMIVAEPRHTRGLGVI